VPEEIDGEDVMIGQPRGERREMPTVVADAVEADDSPPRWVAPLVEGERHADA
jgi:hypothetical protein